MGTGPRQCRFQTGRLANGIAGAPSPLLPISVDAKEGQNVSFYSIFGSVEFKGFVLRSNPSGLINTSKRWQNGSSRQFVIRPWGLKTGRRYTFTNMFTSAR